MVAVCAGSRAIWAGMKAVLPIDGGEADCLFSELQGLTVASLIDWKWSISLILCSPFRRTASPASPATERSSGISSTFAARVARAMPPMRSAPRSLQTTPPLRPRRRQAIGDAELT